MTKSIKSSVYPKGYSGKSFNQWQAYLQKQIDRIKNTNVSAKLR